MSASKEVIVIGAGHNGLTCACYLARRGLPVRVLERRDVVGGAAVTEEFHPGFRNSTASYTVSLLQQRIIDELNLHAHGLEIVERPVGNFVPGPADDALVLGPSPADTHQAVAAYSARDAERLPAFEQMLERAAEVLRATLLQTPPHGNGGFGDLPRLLRDANRLRKLDIETRRDLLALFSRSAGEILDEWFESDRLKAALGFDSIVGHYASPYTPGSGYVLLHHVFGGVNGKPGVWGHAIGGMGAITQALAAEARRLGVQIETGAGVQRVLTEPHGDRHRVSGVELEDGRRFSGARIASNLNPRLLYGSLMPEAALPEGFRDRMAAYRCGSGTFRMNVALSGLPRFTARPEAGPHHASGIILGPSLEYMDRAYQEARTEGWSRRPVVEMVIPSTLDDSLAPAGRHVASLFCQQFAPELPSGDDWAGHREAAVDSVFDAVEAFAPGFRNLVLGYQALSPSDLEQRFGLIGGDIFHGVLAPDQLYSARPLLGYGDYRGPVEGLYHCGSGAHPGGGVTGAPGYNAAWEILRDRFRPGWPPRPDA